MTHAVTQGTFADIKTVKTRSVAQLIIEVPIETINDVLKALGGYPQPGKEPWVAVARLTEQAAPSASGDASPPERTGKDKRAWAELSPVEQAGMLPDKEDFKAYVASVSDRSPIEYIRLFCGVTTRGDLKFNTAAQAKWKELCARFFNWKNHGAVA